MYYHAPFVVEEIAVREREGKDFHEYGRQIGGCEWSEKGDVEDY